MLRFGSAKLTRSAYLTNTSCVSQTLPICLKIASDTKNNNLFYHQTRSQIRERERQKEIMSGSAMDQLKELMSMIDEFESNIAKGKSPTSQKSQSEQKYQSIPLSQGSTNLPKCLINTDIPFSHQIIFFFSLEKFLDFFIKRFIIKNMMNL